MVKIKRNASMIILVNKENKILMQHRTKDAPLYPDHWAFFGGGFQAGESAEECLKREISEEIGYKLKDVELLLSIKYKSEKHFGKKYYYLVKYDYKQEIILKEGQGYDWISLDKLTDYKISQHNLEILEKVQSLLMAS